MPPREGQFQQVVLVLSLSLSRVTASICPHARAAHAINGAFSRAAGRKQKLGLEFGKEEGRKNGCNRDYETWGNAERNILCTLDCLSMPISSQSMLIIVVGEGTWQRGWSTIPVRHVYISVRYVLS